MEKKRWFGKLDTQTGLNSMYVARKADKGYEIVLVEGSVKGLRDTEVFYIPESWVFCLNDWARDLIKEA